MHLRLATTRDLHRLAQITITSLVDDPTFDFLWPNRHTFPEDNFFFWQLKLKQYLYSKNLTFLVAVLDEQEPELVEQTHAAPDTIISYAVWERLGKSRAARKRRAEKNTWLNVMDNALVKLEAWSISLKYARRDADMARLAAFESVSKINQQECFSDVKERWSLQLLVTDRRFRREGTATMLVKWGTEEADREGVACCVETSAMGTRIYEKCGFDKIKTSVVNVGGQAESLQYVVMHRRPLVAHDVSVSSDALSWHSSVLY